MVAGRWSDECEACGVPYGKWVASLGMALCGSCERAGSEHPAREPVLVGDVLAGMTEAVTHAARSGRAVPDARRPSTATCGACGAGAEWHRTVRGRWVMIEPGELPARVVPAGSRWRVAGDGTAVNLGSAVPSDTCRVSHFDVCPGRPAPIGSPVLLALWRGHARRAAT
ncbi:hypothetical protein AQF52_4137 [Streptomyces venezuelae]|uniref:DUF6083 domain-containing protein n=1 Tax=Streptomyces TaxID=1883 RepID=UPI0006BCB52E|nr:DUF6083 domain-containing protein [Streptomyces gardneri]ALO09731.1 hypothetical protein AQF52_4137 [Streptomyces venezuelae]WRK38199.1 DUF6083 domain-containing protein [Streptomyces venezuelae]CUM39836.1 hypothetical protein BN2537_8637 [Streptomyces venezuelae]